MLFVYSHVAAGPPSLQVSSQLWHHLDLPQNFLQTWFSFRKITVHHPDVSERHWLRMSRITSAMVMGQTAEFTACACITCGCMPLRRSDSRFSSWPFCLVAPIHRRNPSPALSVIFSPPNTEMTYQNVAFKLCKPNVAS